MGPFAAAAATLPLLAGCIAETALPTFAAPGPVTSPGTSGRLRLERTCLRFETAGGTSFLVVWPHGARVDFTARPPLVLDAAGRGARVGEAVRLTEFHASAPWSSGSRKINGIIRRCGGPLFMTYGFLPYIPG